MQTSEMGPGFNEAAGIHRRKLMARYLLYVPEALASMRPPEFTGGNRVTAVGDAFELAELQ